MKRTLLRFSSCISYYLGGDRDEDVGGVAAAKSP